MSRDDDRAALLERRRRDGVAGGEGFASKRTLFELLAEMLRPHGFFVWPAKDGGVVIEAKARE